MIRRLLPATIAAICLATGASAEAPAPGSALGRVSPGQWEVLEPAATPVLLCVRDPQDLARLRHIGAQCRNFVVENTLRRATVHYECPGKGYGQTTLRVQTAGQATLDSQGVEAGVPFAFTAQARRVGPCRP